MWTDEASRVALFYSGRSASCLRPLKTRMEATNFNLAAYLPYRCDGRGERWCDVSGGRAQRDRC